MALSDGTTSRDGFQLGCNHQQFSSPKGGTALPPMSLDRVPTQTAQPR